MQGGGGDKEASDKVASDKVASGQSSLRTFLKKSSLLRKVLILNKGHSRSAQPPGLPSRGRSAPYP